GDREGSTRPLGGVRQGREVSEGDRGRQETHPGAQEGSRSERISLFTGVARPERTRRAWEASPAPGTPFASAQGVPPNLPLLCRFPCCPARPNRLDPVERFGDSKAR